MQNDNLRLASPIPNVRDNGTGIPGPMGSSISAISTIFVFEEAMQRDTGSRLYVLCGNRQRLKG